MVDENIVYRPDLAIKAPHATRVALVAHQPDALVTRKPVDPLLLDRWRSAVGYDRPLLLVHIADGPEDGTGYEQLPPNIELHRIDATGDGQPEVKAFEWIEQRNTARLPEAASTEVGERSFRPTGRNGRRRVVLIGAGIVNLVTAYSLAQQGYEVECHDASPDPLDPDGDWRDQGCTFGGNDARIFSLNETRHHHYRGGAVDATTNTDFRRLVADGGWLSRAPDRLSATDQQWIEEFERVPQWLAARFERDLVAVNRESHVLWRQLLADRPDLFEGVGFHDGLLRLYPDADGYAAARQKERAIGALQREIDPVRLGEEFPSLREAVDGGAVGGALEVVGFSLNIHRFGHALIRHLTREGARFVWNSRVECREDGGRGGCRTFLANGEVLEADGYVISVGATGNGLLRAFDCREAVAPVIGMWITLPGDTPKLDRPIKITRAGYAAGAGAAQGANVIGARDRDGRDVIHLGSGHGFIGHDIAAMDPDQIADLARAVEDTARRFFPSRYEKAQAMGMLDGPRRYCIRPWTPSGLGLFERLRDEARDG
ncbi:NAD(P)/FAD-dependent oxidoreductase [Azospirillum brasilense]|uniref:NAD(P)/FAD-dependent oxidoreductase n=1 Tax=Azospirillum brasilense TaxID=192 RepID=UPI001EDAF3D8|nr:FAD-dependent oxidoreductase [Azospirillum brasilense]UKJ76237.1 FAD-dependent oxidoreductase [Azospirillum brasilense]